MGRLSLLNRLPHQAAAQYLGSIHTTDEALPVSSPPAACVGVLGNAGTQLA